MLPAKCQLSRPDPLRVSLFLLFFLMGCEGGVRQPIGYNHKKHIELGLECGFCHTGIAQGKTTADLPSIDICLSCHSDDGNPKTQLIRSYASAQQEIPWIKVYRVPDHVYFSHRRHVELAKLDCELCHGNMPKKKTPVRRQAVPIKMERCIACHYKNNVTNDCLSCHR